MEFQETEWDQDPDLFATKIRGIARRQLNMLMHRKGEYDRAREQLEDTLQEVMCWLWKNNYHALRRWDPCRGVPFEGYVAVVVKHRALTVLRRARSGGGPTGDSDKLEEIAVPESPDHHVESRDFTRKAVQQLERRLTARGCEIFHALFVEELSIDEAESCLGVSKAALYQWRLRLRRELRDVLSGL